MGPTLDAVARVLVVLYARNDAAHIAPNPLVVIEASSTHFASEQKGLRVSGWDGSA